MHNYDAIIRESPEELQRMSRQHRHSVVGTRLNMLKNLKSGEARSLPAVAQQLGYPVKLDER